MQEAACLSQEAILVKGGKIDFGQENSIQLTHISYVNPYYSFLSGQDIGEITEGFSVGSMGISSVGSIESMGMWGSRDWKCSKRLYWASGCGGLPLNMTACGGRWWKPSTVESGVIGPLARLWVPMG